MPSSKSVASVGQETIPPQRVISRIFESIAHRYDNFNRVASLGLDRIWRRKAAALIPSGASVLDVGCGTGDFTFAAAPQADHVVGVDLCHQMLARAEAKAKRWKLEDKCLFRWGLAEGLPFPDESFDTVISAFVLRSLVGKMDVVIKEMSRVLRPEGQLILLENLRPSQKVLRALHGAYLRTAMPTIGWIITRQVQPFLFLKESIEEFYSPSEFFFRLVDNGFEYPDFLPLSGGIAGIFTANKPGEPKRYDIFIK